MTDWYWRSGHPDDGTDWWPAIRDHLPAGIVEARSMLRYAERLVPMMEERFRAGEKEYQGEWLTQRLSFFDRMADEELADLIVYLAMRRVRAEQIRVRD